MTSGQYEALSNQNVEDRGRLPLMRSTTPYDDLYPDHDREQLRTPSPVSDSDRSSTATLISHVEQPEIRITVSSNTPSLITTPGPRSLHHDKMEHDSTSELLRIDLLKYSLSPETHHPRFPSISTTSSLSHPHTEKGTAREYNYWRQARRLWRLAASEWLITVALCGAFGGILKSYSGRHIITSVQVSLINTLLTILTFLLGVNLAASMRSYAKLLRWRLLSLCWQPLETFDLVLRCDSLVNVCNLIWKIRKQNNTRLRWVTQALAMLWLALNIALTVSVGLFGFAYNTDSISSLYVHTDLGRTQITDFSQLKRQDLATALISIQSWGVKAFDYKLVDGIGYNLTDISQAQTLHQGTTRYYINAWNPENTEVSMTAHVSYESFAQCDSFDVIYGGDGNSEEVIYYDERSDSLENVTIAFNEQSLPGPGGFVAISQLCEGCSGRLTTIDVFVAGNTSDVGAKWFVCNNTLHDVFWMDRRIKKGSQWGVAPEEYQIDNRTARMLTGAIGWNGDYDYYSSANGRSSWQGVTYKYITEIGRNLRMTYGEMPTTQNMSDFISSFTIKAINMMDNRDDGLQAYKQVFGQIPQKGRVLNVDWHWAIPLLIGIPTLQLAACILVLMVANEAIIKDDSPLATAKLYFSLLKKYGLGDRGCLLKGEELVDHINEISEDPRGAIVTYGWKDTGLDDQAGRPIGHLDVFEEAEEEKTVLFHNLGHPEAYVPIQSILSDLRRVKKVFKDHIMYDGTSEGHERKVDDTSGRRRRRHSASI